MTFTESSAVEQFNSDAVTRKRPAGHLTVQEAPLARARMNMLPNGKPEEGYSMTDLIGGVIRPTERHLHDP